MHGAGWQSPGGLSRYGLHVSEQRARSTAAAEGRPDVPGVPWWGAVLIATTTTLAGIAIDASSGLRELTNVCAALYLIGCVAAVLVVRRSALFTAMVQPPLILFIVVPTAYYLFHRAEIAGVKDVLINCGYPLIQRFPLMLITSLLVLLIGLARWYLGSTDHLGEAIPGAAGPSLWIARQVNTLLGRSTNRRRRRRRRSLTAIAQTHHAPRRRPAQIGRGRPSTPHDVISVSAGAASNGRSRPPGADPTRPLHRLRPGPRRAPRSSPAVAAAPRAAGPGQARHPAPAHAGTHGPACPAPATEPV